MYLYIIQNSAKAMWHRVSRSQFANDEKIEQLT